MSLFPDVSDKAALEEGDALSPRFDASGLITCVATDATTGEVLMVAHMNAESLRRSIETGEAWYWSRSRRELWRKGATSGQIQTIVEMRVDCDQDAIWIKVAVAGDGGCCHTHRRSCFYRVKPLRDTAGLPLAFEPDAGLPDAGLPHAVSPPGVER